MLYRLILLLIPILYLLSPSRSLAQHGFDFRGINVSEYRGIKNISETILRRFPPDEFHYIGLGASPTAILAYLELTLGTQAVSHLPMSNIGSLRNRAEEGQIESEKFRKLLRVHFDTFLPVHLDSGKKLLVIDFALMGETISNVSEFLSSAWTDKGEGDRVRFLALVGSSRLSLLKHFLERKGIDILRLSSEMDDVFTARGFDRYRKFEKFDPLKFGKAADYRPPAAISLPWTPEEYLETLKRGHFVQRTYEHLLFEMERFMKTDGFGFSFFRSLMRRSPRNVSFLCRQVFSSQ